MSHFADLIARWNAFAAEASEIFATHGLTDAEIEAQVEEASCVIDETMIVHSEQWRSARDAAKAQNDDVRADVVALMKTVGNGDTASITEFDRRLAAVGSLRAQLKVLQKELEDVSQLATQRIEWHALAAAKWAEAHQLGDNAQRALKREVHRYDDVMDAGNKEALAAAAAGPRPAHASAASSHSRSPAPSTSRRGTAHSFHSALSSAASSRHATTLNVATPSPQRDGSAHRDAAKSGERTTAVDAEEALIAACAESPQLTAEKIRAENFCQDLSLTRLERLCAATGAMMHRARRAGDRRADQQRHNVFARLWPRVQAVAVGLAGSRNTFVGNEVSADIATLRAGREARLSRAVADLLDAGSQDLKDITAALHVKDVPACVADLYRAVPPDARLALIDAEERFVLDRLVLYESARLATTLFDVTAQCKAYHAMTGDAAFATAPCMKEMVPTRYHALLLPTDDGEPSLTAFQLVQQKADGDVDVPVATLFTELELLCAAADDMARLQNELTAKMRTMVELVAPLRKRQGILDDFNKHCAVSAKDRLTSRKAGQAQALVHEARVRQQMREHLPALERSLAAAVTTFVEEHPTHGAPLTFFGHNLEEETWPHAAAAAQASAAANASVVLGASDVNASSAARPKRVRSTTPAPGTMSAPPTRTPTLSRPLGTSSTTPAARTASRRATGM